MSGPRVLVVDDDGLSRTIVVTMLGRLGFTVDTAGSGEEALAALARDRFDLVLLDLHLADMTGFDVCRELGSRLGERAPRLVAMSALLDGDHERCLAAGMAGSLAKPIELAALAELVGAVDGDLPAAPGGSGNALLGDIPPAIVRRLVEQYLAEAPQLVAALVAAVSGGDAEAVHRAAHALAGRSRNFGLSAVVAPCQELELAARRGEVGAAAGRLQAVEEAVAQAVAIVAAELDRLER